MCFHLIHELLQVIKDWLDNLLMKRPNGDKGESPVAHNLFPFPKRLKSIECSAEICAFTKCFLDDVRCRA